MKGQKLGPAPIPKHTPFFGHEGWAKPIGSALRHYLRKQQSLCGTWGYFGDVLTDKSTAEKCEACAAAHRREQ